MRKISSQLRTLTVLGGLALAAAPAACGFETPDPAPAAPLVLPAPLDAWCAPVPTDGVAPASDEALPTFLERVVGPHHLTATWTYAAAEVRVERALDGAVYETQRWGFDPAGNLVERTIHRDPLGAEGVGGPLDDLAAAEDWSRALPEVASADRDCLQLPSSFGHGYPAAEGWYRPGAVDPDAPETSPLGWYGHEGDGSGLAEGTLAVTVRYDARGRMIAEDLERRDGLHDLERRRVFDGETLVVDRLERFSPTPKEDTVRELRFALTTSGGSARLRRDLVDTWDTLLERRYLSGTAPR